MKRTYRGMSNEIGHTDELAAMCVDVGLVPGIRVRILGLNNVGQGDGPIGLDEILEGGVVAIVGGIELVFDGRKDGPPRNSGLRVGNVGYRKKIQCLRDQRDKYSSPLERSTSDDPQEATRSP